LNQTTNIGDYDRTKFAFMPEVAVNLGYRVTNFITMFVGYDFLYINNVLRPGQQVDTTVNPSLIPFSGLPAGGSQRPMFPNHGESYWLQGITFGIALRF
jgi:hypothetical protein